MYLFKKKKLTLREIHKLYLLLKPCLPEKEDPYLLGEIEAMLENSNEAILTKSIDIIYKENVDEKNTVELLILFVNGLKSTGFFAYMGFIKGMNAKD